MSAAKVFMFAAGFLTVTAMMPAIAADGDVAAGEKVFRKCKACHVLDEEKNKVGPHLVAIIDRPVASVEGFKYSKAMKAKGEEGMVWTEETLTEYLKAPRKFIKGTKMAFAGLKKDEDITNLIAYVKEPPSQ